MQRSIITHERFEYDIKSTTEFHHSNGSLKSHHRHTEPNTQPTMLHLQVSKKKQTEREVKGG